MRRAAAALLLLASACAGPEVAVDRSYDFKRVKRVGVVAFEGPSGAAAADLLTHELLASGASVAERGRLEAVFSERRLKAGGSLGAADVRRAGKALGVDAIFLGSVTQLAPAQSFLVMEPRKGVMVTDSARPIGGGSLTRTPALGAPGASVLTSSAQVGLTARLVDVNSGAVVWSAHQSYEGFDTDSAMAAVARSFARSLAPLWAPR